MDRGAGLVSPRYWVFASRVLVALECEIAEQDGGLVSERLDLGEGAHHHAEFVDEAVCIESEVVDAFEELVANLCLEEQPVPAVEAGQSKPRARSAGTRGDLPQPASSMPTVDHVNRRTA
jgi:hypothetical protein